MWWIYALLSAFFAALTAIFAKVGIKGADTDLATAIRTLVVLVVAWAVAFFRGDVSTMGALTKQNILFLVLSGLATGLSWIFYYTSPRKTAASRIVNENFNCRRREGSITKYLRLSIQRAICL